MEFLQELFFKILGYGLFIAIILGLLGLFIEAIKCAFNLNRDYKTAFKKKSDFDNEFENLFKKYFNNTETLNPEDYDIDISIKIKSKS